MANSINTKPLNAGQSIREYEIRKVCHEGQIATTYRARHERLGRDVALRVHGSAADTPMQEILKSWARRLIGLRHRCLAEMTDFGFLDDNRFYCAWVWVEGEPLAEPESLPPREKDFSDLLHQMCSALDALHEADLAHGAIGPGVFVVHEGEPCLLPPSFANREVSHPDDIRALGEVIFHLLIRRDALDTGETQDLRSRGGAIEEVGDESLAILSPELAAVIARCRAEEPTERYKSAEAIARDVDVALDLALDLPLEMALGIVRGQGATPADMLPADVLETGDVVGETYRITALLGRGGMGQVYEARHLRLPQRVAIKVIAGEYTDEAVARFRREAEISSSLGHPHIVSVFDFNTLPDGKPYMVMELLAGENLGAALRRGAMGVERTLRITKQLGSALAAAHDKGIVHRDLKPANIFLSQVEIAGTMREHATILDFGISKREDSSSSFTHSEAVIGTPQYMAPEQAKADNHRVGAASDQFALATIVYEMLAGHAAFGRGTLAEIVYRVCHTEPPDIRLMAPELGSACAAAIARAMSKDREERFDSVAQFVAALTNAPEPATAKQAPDSEAAMGSNATGLEHRTPPNGPDAPTVPNKNPEKPSEDASGSLSEHPPAGARAVSRPILVVVVVLASAALGLIVLTGKDRDEASVAEPKTATEAPTEALMATNVAIVSRDAGPRSSSRGDAAPVLADASLKTPARGPRVRAETRPDPAQLQQAEALLASGRFRDARKLIQTTPLAAKTAKGYAITVKSYCGEGNFGAAQDWLARVPKKSRAAVRAYCKREHAIALD